MPIPSLVNLAVAGITSEAGVKRNMSMEQCQKDHREKATKMMQGHFLKKNIKYPF